VVLISSCIKYFFMYVYDFYLKSSSSCSSDAVWNRWPCLARVFVLLVFCAGKLVLFSVTALPTILRRALRRLPSASPPTIATKTAVKGF
jgi:hypothetical protein